MSLVAGMPGVPGEVGERWRGDGDVVSLDRIEPARFVEAGARLSADVGGDSALRLASALGDAKKVNCGLAGDSTVSTS